MKQAVKNLVVVGAMLAAGSVAAMMDDMKPYVGLDYYQAWMKGVKDTGFINDNGNIFLVENGPKSYPGMTVYVGAKFTDYSGIELGADWSAPKKKTIVEAGNSLTLKVKRMGMHADIVGSFSLNDCVDLLGFVGLGWVKPKLTLIETLAGVTNSDTPKIKAKAIPRFGVGASYMITEMVGLRAKAGWENTRQLKSREGNVKIFKDTVSLSLGAFVRW